MNLGENENNSSIKQNEPCEGASSKKEFEYRKQIEEKSPSEMKSSESSEIIQRKKKDSFEKTVLDFGNANFQEAPSRNDSLPLHRENLRRFKRPSKSKSISSSRAARQEPTVMPNAGESIRSTQTMKEICAKLENILIAENPELSSHVDSKKESDEQKNAEKLNTEQEEKTEKEEKIEEKPLNLILSGERGFERNGRPESAATQESSISIDFAYSTGKSEDPSKNGEISEEEEEKKVVEREDSVSLKSSTSSVLKMKNFTGKSEEITKNGEISEEEEEEKVVEREEESVSLKSSTPTVLKMKKSDDEQSVHNEMNDESDDENLWKEGNSSLHSNDSKVNQIDTSPEVLDENS